MTFGVKTQMQGVECVNKENVIYVKTPLASQMQYTPEVTDDIFAAEVAG